MQVSNRTLALVAVAGLALAGYASAASAGLLPEGMDAGLGKEARQAKLDQLQQRCQAAKDGGADVPPICDRILAGELPPFGLAKGPMAQRCAAAAEQGKKPAACGPGPDGRGDARKAMHLAPFHVDGDSVTGKWVSFTVDAAAGELQDFTSKGPFADTVVFDSVSLVPNTDQDKVVVRGPLWLAQDGDVQAAVFDAPNALLVVRNTGDAPATLTFDIGDGIASSQNETGVLLTHDGHTALLRTRGNATLSLADGVVTATLPKGGMVGFGIEGFPRLTAWELQALHAFAHHMDGKDASGRGARGVEEPGSASDLDAAPVEDDGA